MIILMEVVTAPNKSRHRRHPKTIAQAMELGREMTTPTQPTSKEQK